MYNKLFGKIINSSIWLQSDHTRLIWVTMLATMDEDGFCQYASVKNLAHAAMVSAESAMEAVKVLEAPDPDSSDKEFDGRRIERVPGGWLVLNGPKYRELATREQIKAGNRKRAKECRDRKRDASQPVTPRHESVTPSEADTNTKAKEKPSAKASPRGALKPTDPRFHPCIDVLHRYWDKFAKDRIRFDLWMDDPGYRQLKNSLTSHKHMSVEDFTRFVANRARSPGVNHCQPAYEWLGHILDWAGGPKVNGKEQVSKATAREQRIIESAVRAAAHGADSGPSPDPLALPGDGGT